MSYNLNLGQWNSIFAVPTTLVDKHLRLCTETQLKVMLYILRNPSDNTPESIAESLSVSADEVRNAIEFWIERGLMTVTDAQPASSVSAPSSDADTASDSSAVEKNPAKTSPSRARRPDSFFVSKLLKEDASLAGLLEEAQSALSKPLSSGDTATLVMLYDTFGLPCEVIAMLIHYAVSVGRANMRAIERMGIQWSDSGIYTVEDAEREIERLTSCDEAWKHVSSLFGIRNIGHPTKSQLDHALRWTVEWNFSDEMLNEAYERCVNTKGEYHIRYVNGILSKWHEKGIRSLDDLQKEESTPKKPVKKSNAKSSIYSSENATYDVNLLDVQTLFDD